MNVRLLIPSTLVLAPLAALGIGVSEAQAILLVGNTRLSGDGTRGFNVVGFDEDTGVFLGEFIAAGSGGLSNPDDLTFGPDGNLYISSGDTLENSAILRFDGFTGEFIDIFATSDTLRRPYGNAFGPDGNLYVSSFLSDEILRFNGTTGEFIDVFASGDQLPGGLNGPNDLLFAPDGSLLVTTQGSVATDGGATFPGLPSQILKFDLATGASTVFADQPVPTPESFGFVSFLGLALGGDGNLYTSDFANGIRVYDLAGTLLETRSTNFTGTDPSNNFIGSLAFDDEGNLFTVGFDFTQGNVGSILRYDAAPGDSVAPDFQILAANNPNLVRSIGIAYTPAADIPEPGAIAGLAIVGLAGATLRRKQPQQ